MIDWIVCNKWKMQRYQIFVLSLVCCLGTCMVILQTVLNSDSWPTTPSHRGKLVEFGHNVSDDLNLRALEHHNYIGRKIVKNRHRNKHHEKLDFDRLQLVVLMKQRLDFLNRTRNSINYHSILQTFNPLLGMPVIDGKTTKISYVLLSTSFRTGSSFVGDLLQQNWKTFYSFEPFHYMNIQKKMGEERDEEAVNLLENVYKCDFYHLPNYTRWVKKIRNQFLFKWNRFLWSLCSIRRPTCFDPKVISDTCVRSKYRVVKTTRLSLRGVEKLFDKLNGEIDLKVVFLVRDPRAILNSRRHLGWCSNSECSDIDTICSEMQSDIEVYHRLQAKYGDKILALRHEDLSLHPLSTAEGLFAKLNLPFAPRVKRFLRINTEAKVKPNTDFDPYSVKRNSKNVVSRWIHSSNLTDVMMVQEKCKGVLSALGYKAINLTQGLNLPGLEPQDLMESHAKLPPSISW